MPQGADNNEEISSLMLAPDEAFDQQVSGEEGATVASAYDNESIPSNFTHVDWAGIFPRSIRKEGIIGNIAAHYGLVPRRVLIQKMITNHIITRLKSLPVACFKVSLIFTLLFDYDSYFRS
jgi:hypothetical protein